MPDRRTGPLPGFRTLVHFHLVTKRVAILCRAVFFRKQGVPGTNRRHGRKTDVGHYKSPNLLALWSEGRYDFPVTIPYDGLSQGLLRQRGPFVLSPISSYRRRISERAWSTHTSSRDRWRCTAHITLAAPIGRLIWISNCFFTSLNCDSFIEIVAIHALGSSIGPLLSSERPRRQVQFRVTISFHKLDLLPPGHRV